MKTRIKTAFIYGIVMAILLIPGFFIPDITLLLILFVALLAPPELQRAFEYVQIKLDKALLYCFSLAFLPAYLYLKIKGASLLTANTVWHAADKAYPADGQLALQIIAVYGICLFVVTGIAVFQPLLKRGAQAIPQIIGQLAAGFYLSLPLFFGFCLLFIIPGGWFWFVLALATPWIADSCAYFSGVLWGHKPIVPALSPKKTYVGFFGSVIGTVILYIPLFIFLLPKILTVEVNLQSLLSVIVIAAVIGALIELGDWLASGIKRFCGIKDFSDLLPGHGGIIDRFDSTFFTFTAVLAIALAIFFF